MCSDCPAVAALPHGLRGHLHVCRIHRVVLGADGERRDGDLRQVRRTVPLFQPAAGAHFARALHQHVNLVVQLVEGAHHRIRPLVGRHAKDVEHVEVGNEKFHVPGTLVKVICGNPNAAFESIALGCDTWITGIMNAAPRSARRMMRLIREHRDLAAARDVYYRHLLPLVDLMVRNSNPTGTIKTAMRARGLDAGVPRKPGRDVSADDMAALREWARLVDADEPRFGRSVPLARSPDARPV